MPLVDTVPRGLSISTSVFKCDLVRDICRQKHSEMSIGREIQIPHNFRHLLSKIQFVGFQIGQYFCYAQITVLVNKPASEITSLFIHPNYSLKLTQIEQTYMCQTTRVLLGF
ncbi:Hypothetical_protein [Hexamita inflata]|uniref:Hypothetical_protein n=1 Tax=Hexamita inflata TaxID=28002 RepID=A0AA86NU20_9EUKA|nr:Hypothetical protein HINF_LOCUS13780 [Hexamita inflata]CAI9926146.1 Hypothetical protein HINF_LOCUS13791 [Hexamita inflata]